MAYEVYSTQKVFSNELVNIYCNRILDAVHTEFAASETQLVAEGDLSRMIQGMAAAELPVIPFVTNDQNIYNYLVKNLQSILSVETQISFKNRIQVVTSQAYIEIWFEVFSGTENVNGLYCRALGGSYPVPVSPYNIQLADPQVFSESLENELYYQGWSSNVVAPVKIAYVVGSAAPSPVPVNIQVENVFLTQQEGKYSSFKFQTFIVNWNSPFSQYHMGHIQLSGDAAVVNSVDLLEADLDKTIITSFVDLYIMEPGQRTWDLLIEVHGVRTDSGLTDRGITSLSIPFELNVLAEDEIIASKDHLYLAHVRDSLPLEGQEIEVITAGDFSLTIPDLFEVTGGNLVEQAPIYSRRIFWGTGRQTVTIQATAAFDQYEGSIYNSSFQLATRNDTSPSSRSSRGRKLIHVLLSVYIFEEHGFIVNPQSLDFFVIKGLQEASAKALEVISTQEFSVQHPFWLQVNPLAGGIFGRLSVQPISSENLISGEYSGYITLTSAAAQMEVPVFMKVVESIDEGFSQTAINFTDDVLFSYFYSSKATDRARAILNITAYDFHGFGRMSQNSFEMAFFRNSTRIHLGGIIARRFEKISLKDIGYKHFNLEEQDPQLFQIYPYYKPASVGTELQIEDRSTGMVSERETFKDIKFVKGRIPKQFANNYGILNYEAVPVRVTKNSQVLFNFLRQFSQHEIKIYKNGSIYKTVTHSPGNDSLFGMAMFFKDFNPGDVIDVKLAKSETEDFVQQYVVFPEQPHSNHLVFENEYNILESYEFTGAFRFSSKYSPVAAISFKELVERVENLETNKEQRLVINTGWILKSNQVIIDAIIRSSRIWFVKNGKEISLTVVGKEIINEESSQALYSYDIEFIINRENDAEVYIS